MKFSVSLFQSRTAGQSDRSIYGEAIEQIRLAEALGFHAAWFNEQHFNDFGICPDPLSFAAYLAGVTGRIRLGTAVVVLSLHNPVVVAERAALVDQLSKGRLDLGIGKAPAKVNFGAFGVEPAESSERFSEAHALLKAAWSGEAFSFQGKYFSVQDVHIVPRPLQSPHPPIWVASFGSPESITFAAENGYPLIHTFGGETLKKNMDLYRNQFRGPGAPLTVVGRALHLHREGGRAREEMAGPARWYVENNPGRRGPILSYETALSDFFDKLGIIGSVEECIERIRLLQTEYRVDQLVCIFGLGGLAHEKIMAAMRLFAEKVMPEFVD
jgi:alkanesulfonate monooxygenase SsuD/methylene tetrahydromethanopterin reductase-like flavin-dependent oxidoreductase (luciferase family)